jgi:hypothetical protein
MAPPQPFMTALTCLSDSQSVVAARDGLATPHTAIASNKVLIKPTIAIPPVRGTPMHRPLFLSALRCPIDRADRAPGPAPRRNLSIFSAKWRRDRGRTCTSTRNASAW